MYHFRGRERKGFPLLATVLTFFFEKYDAIEKPRIFQILGLIGH